jgi:molybdopterin-containing oxidoreductase family iron-sulfur binding subunit
MKEISLASYIKHPTEIREERDHEFRLITEGGDKMKEFEALEKFEKEATIYPVYDRPGIKWG